MTRLREEKKEMAYKDSMCTMCTTRSHAAYHTHFSTANIRRFALNHGKSGTFMCPICKDLEPVVNPMRETKRVVLTSSTLYGVWDKTMPQNTIHFDMEAIVGGRVRDLKLALEKNYLYLPNRLEIIVIAGINNIGEGQQADQIIAEMKEMKEMVLEHSKKWMHDHPSYVSFCTLIIPPKFCSLHVPPPNPNDPWLAEWTPGPRFRNRYEEVRKVNEQVKEMNLKEGLKYVNLHLHGIKTFKSGTTQHKFDTRPGATQIWREKEVARKLHFTMENKLKIISYVSNCFRGNAREPT